MASEQEEFLKQLGVENQENVLEQPLTETTEESSDDELTEQKLKNRRERRLMDKLQTEREANIALNARLQTIAESKEIRAGSEEADYLRRIEKIYGNATPEAKEATELLKEAFQGLRKDVKEEFSRELTAQETSEAEANRTEERNLDNILDEVEENHGIDMSNDKERIGFLSLLERASPKDEEGYVMEYADPDTVAEVYLANKTKSSSRAKELASRSMTRSGASQESKLQDDATVRFLKENGIL